MSAQLTVRLPDDLNRALADAAARMQRKRAEIVRLALNRVRGLIGSPESGIQDLAESHRSYVLDSLENEP